MEVVGGERFKACFQPVPCPLLSTSALVGSERGIGLSFFNRTGSVRIGGYYRSR